jgi:hypothetical protein
MTFDIVVPTYGQRSLLRKTLRVIASRRRSESLSMIHVVENGPKGSAEKVCEDFGDTLPILYHYVPDAGLAGARNVGIDASAATFLLFIDDDITLLPDTLECYASAFENYGDHTFFGGPLLPDYESPPPEWLRQFLPMSAKGFSLGEAEVSVSEPVFLGGNFAVSRKGLLAVGSFEGACATGERGGGVGEEKRLQQRLLRAGYSGRFLPCAGVLHYVPIDRCNQRFVCHRRWRHGYSEGQEAGARAAACKESQGRTLFGVPAWYWRHLGKSYLRAGLGAIVKERGDRLRILLEAYEAWGFVNGYRAGKGDRH